MSTATSDTRQAILRRRVAKIPTDPGVYRWLDADKNVLYIGKAKNLRNRMKTYVQDGLRRSPWTEIMVRQIADFEVTVVRSELEAFILESNLIKQLRPKYNVLLKDDKGYVYVRVSVHERYPRVDVVRRLENDGAKYFGPFLGARSTHQTLDMLDSILTYRVCKKSLDTLNAGKPLSTSTPCLDHQIGKCAGLCIGSLTETQYRERIDHIVRFFRGNFASVKTKAQEDMKNAALEKKFEKAARIRDVVRFIDDLEQRQIVSDASGDNADIFGIALSHGKIQVVLLRQRDGKLVEQMAFPLRGEADTPADALAQFLPQYYEDTQDLPDIVILGEMFPEAELLTTWLTQRRGKIVKLLIPERGKKSKLLEMAERNAEEKVQQQFAAWEAEIKTVEGALTELAFLVRLPEPPRRIEGYDISHLGGTATVGSMVVFVNGKPKREHYRSFNMKTVQDGAIDDYKSIKETLRRRLKYLTHDLKTEEEKWKAKDITFGKVRKEEREKALAIIRAQTFSHLEVDYGECIVARKDGEIVACGNLHRHPSGRTELFSVWVGDDMRGDKLGQVISRMLLKRVQKKKIYLGTKPSLEEYYADIGFRHVINPSPELVTEINRNVPAFASDIIMMYDGKGHQSDVSFSERPDLLLIDGGKGQLSAATEVLDDLGLTIPVAGLAKREEEIFLPGESSPLAVASGSPARFLLQRVRDEAHRFANAKREKRLDLVMTRSKLDEIPGIGETTKKQLLKQFGSADAVISAQDAELAEILTQSQHTELRKCFPRNIS